MSMLAQSQAARLIDWLIENAITSEDGLEMLSAYGDLLNAADLPILRLNIALPMLDPANRGVNLTWWRDQGASMSVIAHEEAAPDPRQSPVLTLLAEGRQHARWRLDRGESCDAYPIFDDLRQAQATEYLLDLVRFAKDVAIEGAAISYATDRPGGFSPEDVAVIEAQRNAFALAVYRSVLSRTMTLLLHAYVGPMAARRVLKGDVRRGQGEVIMAAVVLVDLKRFTALTDREEPMRVVGCLDQHLEALGSGIDAQGGEIVNFTGDGFVAIFPSKVRDRTPCLACTGALAAVETGLTANRALQPARARSSEPWLPADLALHYGEVVFGNIGTASRIDFTVIGRAVNEASRIEALCDDLDRNVLISDVFARRCDQNLVDLGCFQLRGLVEPRRIWTVPDTIRGTSDHKQVQRQCQQSNSAAKSGCWSVEDQLDTRT